MKRYVRMIKILFFFFFVICLFLFDRRRYNIKEVNLLITVYSLSTAYNLTKSRKKRSYSLRNTTRNELHKTRKQYLHKRLLGSTYLQYTACNLRFTINRVF